MKEINKLEWRIIGADFNKNAPGRLLCDEFYNVGYDNFEALIQIGIRENFNKFDKVFTAASQFAHKGSAHFANFFGINYPTEASIDICLNKILYYKSFVENNIPIPKTLIVKNQDELQLKINEIDSEFFYLKSDFSKNPNYVYSFNKNDIPRNKIFWGKDRYLRNSYVLQPAIRGHPLRINIYGNRFNVFDFITNNKTNLYHNVINKFNIIKSLKMFLINLGIEDWLIKFDIIISENNYVVLDIGLDPPMRMKKFSKINKLNFEKFYIRQYLYKELIYPNIFDE